MSTMKERFTVALEPGVSRMLENYWRVNYYKNRNEAVNHLLGCAMADKTLLTADEEKLVKEYQEATDLAKKMAHAALKAGKNE